MGGVLLTDEPPWKGRHVSRAHRLLDLLQILRRHRRPVSGRQLADELAVSLRTLYRDIATLQGQGAPIEGEAGFGYVLHSGYLLPPLSFTEEEVEALVLGSRWVAERGDSPLAAAARDAVAKIAAVLPDELRHLSETSPLMVGPGGPLAAADAHLTVIRRAIRHEHKVEIAYRDAAGAETRRTIWPFAVGFFDHAHVVVAWCELREALRFFRTDRIAALVATTTRYPQRRHALLKAWRQAEGRAAD
jgi:predicted DNA-binding transcriptional regulator YafY